MRIRRCFFWFFIFSGWITVSAQTQLILHITNPWWHDTNAELRTHLRIMGNAEVGGWYSGSDMTPEGEVWFSWTITKYEKKGWTFNLVNWVGPEIYMGRVHYSHKFNLDAIMAQFSPPPSELWISVLDTNKAPEVFISKPTTGISSSYGPVNPLRPAKAADFSTLTMYTLSGRTIARLHPPMNDGKTALAEGLRCCRGTGRVLCRFGDDNEAVSAGAVIIKAR